MVAFAKGDPSDSSSLNSAPVRNNLDALFEGDFEPLRVRAQSTPDMTVQVEDDNNRAYVEGNTPLDFVGGNSPSFTAPGGANEKQIDILTLNSSGTLAITSGTPTTGTPVPPDYPSDEMVLVEIYLRNGMSSIKNTDDATNGYIFKVRTPVFNLGGSGIPVSGVIPYGGSSSPTGFLLCDGSAVSQSTYAALYAVIGTTFGDPGGGNFNLPDMRGRFPLGKDNMGGGSADRVTDSEADNIGQSSGDEAALIQHNHSHSHTLNANPYDAGNAIIKGAGNGVGGTGTDATSAGSGSSSMNPYLTLNYIIKT